MWNATWFAYRGPETRDQGHDVLKDEFEVKRYLHDMLKWKRQTQGEKKIHVAIICWNAANMALHYS